MLLCARCFVPLARSGLACLACPIINTELALSTRPRRLSLFAIAVVAAPPVSACLPSRCPPVAAARLRLPRASPATQARLMSELLLLLDQPLGAFAIPLPGSFRAFHGWTQSRLRVNYVLSNPNGPKPCLRKQRAARPHFNSPIPSFLLQSPPSPSLTSPHTG